MAEKNPKVVDLGKTIIPKNSNSPKMSVEVVYRQAEPYDVVDVCRCLVEWLESAAKHYPSADPAALASWVLNCITEGYVVIAERPRERRKVVGVAGMIAARVPWNPRIFVYRDQFFYVPKAHRSSGIAKNLMTQLQIKASQDGVPLMMAVISGTNIEKVDKWYELQGNAYVGGTFVFGLSNKTGA